MLSLFKAYIYVSFFCARLKLTNHEPPRLAAVNFFLGCVGVTQVTRILLHRRSQGNATTAQAAKEEVRDLKETAKGVVGDAKSAVGR